MKTSAIITAALIALNSSPALTATKEWTILVYLDADNDLEGDGIVDVNEMEQVGSDEHVNVVVQMDRIPGEDDSNGDWTDTRRFYILWDDDLSAISSAQVGPQLGELNMGDPQTLADFLEWGMLNYPANRYMLVLWNHGGGWRETGWPTSLTKGVAWDETDNHDYLELREVKSALTAVKANTGQDIDLLGFDACIMGLVEVAYELRDAVTDVVIASQENEPHFGWYYTGFLQDLQGDPTATSAQLSTYISNGMRRSAMYIALPMVVTALRHLPPTI